MMTLLNPSFRFDDVPVDICIVGGAGHIGLPLAIVLASIGRRVSIYDKDRKAVDTIRQGQMPFMEQGADRLLKEALTKGLLSFSCEPNEVAGVPTIIITIGTPVDEFLNPDLNVIRKCVDEISPFLSDGQLIIVRSTVFPGTTEWLDKYMLSKGVRLTLSFCPERVVQGCAIEELGRFPQIVSGTTPEAEDAAANLFSPIVPDIVRLSPIEAEFAKLFSNAYRYIQFAVSNQFYMMASSAGVNFYRILDGAKKNYPRLSDVPSAGFAAGPCLFKDSVQLASFFNNELNIAHTAMLINEGLPAFIVNRLLKKHDLEHLTVGLLGMAFKADSDDPRSSLSYKLKKMLAFKAKAVLTTDPYVNSDSDILLLDDVIMRSDILILCVPHSPYRDMNLEGKIVVDVWNYWGKGDYM